MLRLARVVTTTRSTIEATAVFTTNFNFASAKEIVKKRLQHRVQRREERAHNSRAAVRHLLSIEQKRHRTDKQQALRAIRSQGRDAPDAVHQVREPRRPVLPPECVIGPDELDRDVNEGVPHAADADGDIGVAGEAA